MRKLIYASIDSSRSCHNNSLAKIASLTSLNLGDKLTPEMFVNLMDSTFVARKEGRSAKTTQKSNKVSAILTGVDLSAE